MLTDILALCGKDSFPFYDDCSGNMDVFHISVPRIRILAACGKMFSVIMKRGGYRPRLNTPATTSSSPLNLSRKLSLQEPDFPIVASSSLMYGKSRQIFHCFLELDLLQWSLGRLQFIEVLPECLGEVIDYIVIDTCIGTDCDLDCRGENIVRLSGVGASRNRVGSIPGVFTL